MTKPAYQEGIEELFKQLESGRDGLTKSQVENNLKKYGKNALAETDKTPARLKFLQQFKDVLIILLIASMLVSIYLGDDR